MPTVLPESCQKKSRYVERPYANTAPDDLELIALWNYKRPWQFKKERCVDWCYATRSHYDLDKRLTRVFHWCHRPRVLQRHVSAPDIPSAGAEHLRDEFTSLVEQWRRETQHLSQISKKVAHPAYMRIVGMGESVLPLLLEALRDRPTYWFVALKSIANVDPVPADSNPLDAREAWLRWGRARGLVK
jgi:hypothetical protein